MAVASAASVTLFLCADALAECRHYEDAPSPQRCEEAAVAFHGVVGSTRWPSGSEALLDATLEGLRGASHARTGVDVHGVWAGDVGESLVLESSYTFGYHDPTIHLPPGTPVVVCSGSRAATQRGFTWCEVPAVGRAADHLIGQMGPAGAPNPSLRARGGWTTWVLAFLCVATFATAGVLLQRLVAARRKRAKAPTSSRMIWMAAGACALLPLGPRMVALALSSGDSLLFEAAPVGLLMGLYAPFLIAMFGTFLTAMLAASRWDAGPRAHLFAIAVGLLGWAATTARPPLGDEQQALACSLERARNILAPGPEGEPRAAVIEQRLRAAPWSCMFGGWEPFTLIVVPGVQHVGLGFRDATGGVYSIDQDHFHEERAEDPSEHPYPEPRLYYQWAGPW